MPVGKPLAGAKRDFVRTREKVRTVCDFTAI